MGGSKTPLMGDNGNGRGTNLDSELPQGKAVVGMLATPKTGRLCFYGRKLNIEG